MATLTRVRPSKKANDTGLRADTRLLAVFPNRFSESMPLVFFDTHKLLQETMRQRTQNPLLPPSEERTVRRVSAPLPPSRTLVRVARDFTPKKILRKPSVLDRTGWSAPTLWRRVKDGSFPPPRQIGPRAVGWLESEVEAAIAAFPIVNQEKRPAS
jgi:predicted DNA-binding transcriptional regulator AlpA